VSDDELNKTAKLSIVSAAKERAAQFVVDRAEESVGSGETRVLLQKRLTLAAACLLAVTGAFFIRSFFIGIDVQGGGIRFGVIVVLGVTLVALSRAGELSMAKLRLAELAVFGVPALQVARGNYLRVLEMARALNETMVLGEMMAMAFGCFAIIVFYGMFIPNTVRRAGTVIGGYGLLFLLLVPIMRFHDPEAWRFIMEVVGWEQRSDMAMMVLFGVLISITGSSIISGLRTEVIAARQMGQYRLTELIGKGGMGEVWKAEHALLARPAAVKLIRPEVIDPDNPAKAEAMIRRFEREAQTTALLRSVHTIELYDFGITDGGDLYYVMELLDGIDLETLVNKHGPIAPARARYLLLQVCDSLAEAHENGLVHRDIKPANVLSCRMGMQHDFVKVLDFGLAKHREAQFDPEDIKLTTEGMVIGTPAYMPPETVTRGISDARSDIYALGCVIYWMLTGQLVFEGAHAMSMVVRHVQEMAPSPSKHSKLAIPVGFDRIVALCLEKDPADRPQSAAELADMLRECEIDEDWGEAEAKAWWASKA